MLPDRPLPARARYQDRLAALFGRRLRHVSGSHCFTAPGSQRNSPAGPLLPSCRGPERENKSCERDRMRQSEKLTHRAAHRHTWRRRRTMRILSLAAAPHKFKFDNKSTRMGKNLLRILEILFQHFFLHPARTYIFRSARELIDSIEMRMNELRVSRRIVGAN